MVRNFLFQEDAELQAARPEVGEHLAIFTTSARYPECHPTTSTSRSRHPVQSFGNRDFTEVRVARGNWRCRGSRAGLATIAGAASRPQTTRCSQHGDHGEVAPGVVALEIPG